MSCRQWRDGRIERKIKSALLDQVVRGRFFSIEYTPFSSRLELSSDGDGVDDPEVLSAAVSLLDPIIPVDTIEHNARCISRCQDQNISEVVKRLRSCGSTAVLVELLRDKSFLLSVLRNLKAAQRDRPTCLLMMIVILTSRVRLEEKRLTSLLADQGQISCKYINLLRKI